VNSRLAAELQRFRVGSPVGLMEDDFAIFLRQLDDTVLLVASESKPVAQALQSGASRRTILRTRCRSAFPVSGEIMRDCPA